MTAKSTIGWIGLGNMGQPMTKNLIGAGFPLTVYNRSKEKTVEIAGLGAKVADTPAEAAKGCDVVFTMISDSDVLESVCLGQDGVVNELKPGAILIDMSTVSPESSIKVNEAVETKGCKFLRAPVTGSTVLAAAGTIGILCSGDKEAYDKVLPIFDVLGKNKFYLGATEEARYMKLVLNLMIGNTCQILAESLVYGKQAGLDWAQMLEVIAGSAVASPLVCYKAKPLTERNFNAAFSVKLMEKDFNLALNIAKDLDVCLPTTAITRQLLSSARSIGLGEKDFSSLVLVAEKMSGIEE